jgi:hypothetical protein
VRLDAHPVAGRELIDQAAGGGHRAGPFVARREVPERRRLREMAVEDLQVGSAGAAHRHLDQHLVRSGQRDTAVSDADVAGAEQHRGPHHLRYAGPASRIDGGIRLGGHAGSLASSRSVSIAIVASPASGTPGRQKRPVGQGRR